MCWSPPGADDNSAGARPAHVLRHPLGTSQHCSLPAGSTRVSIVYPTSPVLPAFLLLLHRRTHLGQSVGRRTRTSCDEGRLTGSAMVLVPLLALGMTAHPSSRSDSLQLVRAGRYWLALAPKCTPSAQFLDAAMRKAVWLLTCVLIAVHTPMATPAASAGTPRSVRHTHVDPDGAPTWGV